MQMFGKAWNRGGKMHEAVKQLGKRLACPEVRKRERKKTEERERWKERGGKRRKKKGGKNKIY